MDVRNVKEVTPEVEHNGTVPVWWLIHPREMKERGCLDRRRGSVGLLAGVRHHVLWHAMMLRSCCLDTRVKPASISTAPSA